MFDAQNIQIYDNKEIYIKPKYKDLIDKKVDLFAKNQVHKYASRTNDGSLVSNSKTKKDIANGKYGEYFFSFFVLQEYGFQLLPDVKQYDKDHKSWDHDLPYAQNGFGFPNIAVKTCTKYIWDHFGLSWMFQWNNPRDRLFVDNDPNVIVACMIIDDTTIPESGILAATVPWGKIKLENPNINEVVLGEPKSDRFKGVKKALYYDDILKAI